MLVIKLPLYNYFSGYDHLFFYVAMKNIKDYALELQILNKEARNAMDSYMIMWNCFCHHAYTKPDVYRTIFLSPLQGDYEEYIAEYYSVFPEDLVQGKDEITTLLLKSDVKSRGITTIDSCIKDGYIKKEAANKLNNMTMLIFEGMLTRLSRRQVESLEATLLTMDYIESIIRWNLEKDYDFRYKRTYP